MADEENCPVKQLPIAEWNVTAKGECYGQDSLNVEGLVGIIFFYLIVLLVGLYAGWKKRREEQNQEQVMLAGRDIGLFVGVLTMGATWVGGGFINGSAQGNLQRGPYLDTGPLWICALSRHKWDLFCAEDARIRVRHHD